MDISSYNEADTHNRIDAFIETLETYKGKGVDKTGPCGVASAIARGAWEAGVVMGCTYPGTVCSGIMAALSKYPEVYTEWVLNQKAAIEAAHSTALAGERALACIRHVDLSIAADLFLDISYTVLRVVL